MIMHQVMFKYKLSATCLHLVFCIWGMHYCTSLHTYMSDRSEHVPTVCVIGRYQLPEDFATTLYATMATKANRYQAIVRLVIPQCA